MVRVLSISNFQPTFSTLTKNKAGWGNSLIFIINFSKPNVNFLMINLIRKINFIYLTVPIAIIYSVYQYLTPNSTEIAEYYQEYIVEDIAEYYNFPKDDIQSINFSLVETASNEYKGVIDLDIESESTYLKKITLKVILYYDGDSAMWEFFQ